MRKSTFEQVLALVRNELWNQPLGAPIPTSDIEEILQCAKQQAVSGLVANAIIRNQLPIGDDLTMNVCAIQKAHERNNININTEVAKFSAFLDRRNLDYAIIKGQAMATLYPDPLARTPGDIDFYCPKHAFKQVHEVIQERLGIKIVGNKSKKHDNFEIDGFSFEMHSDMTDFGYWGYQKYWDGFFDKELQETPATVDIDGQAVKTLPPTLNALYIFIHAFYHLILNGNGLGLKQYCDWCLVMHNLHDQIDFPRLDQHLSHLGMKKAYMAVAAFCVQKLGLSPCDVFCDSQTSNDLLSTSEWPERMLDNFLEIRQFSEKVRVSGGVSLRHSLSTSAVVAKQVKTYFSLAPLELIFRIPEMAAWSFKKRFVS